MTVSMVERIAREIARHTALDEGKEPGTADNYTDHVWRDFVGAARAVLTAMREPTDEMVDVGYDADPDDDGDMAPKSVWKAMIDEALSEI